MPKIKKKHLYELAQALINKDGLDAFKMEALASAAGVSRATLYRRVGGRAQLLDAMVAAGLLAPDEAAERDAADRALLALKQVLAQDGFSSATVERVAEVAGVSPVTIYRRFGNRDGLFAAYVRHFSPRRLGPALRDSTGDLEADLLMVIEAALQFLQDHAELVRLHLAGDPEIDRLLHGEQATQERLHLILIDYLQRHQTTGALIEGDPALLAQALGGLMLAVGLAGDAFPSARLSLPEQARLVARIFLDGVRRLPAADQGSSL